jgi:hypothetical protein
MKSRRPIRDPAADRWLTIDATPRPYILGWKPNSAQRQFLQRYERTELRGGASPEEAHRRRLELTSVIEREATLGTPWEVEIRAAIYTDLRALRCLRFFIDGPGAESAVIIRLSMWAHAGDRHPATRDMQSECLVPRDQVLQYLREKRHNGATHAELVSKWGSYATHFGDLRRLGFEIKTTRTSNPQGDDEFRFYLVNEPKRHKLLKQHELYSQIARGIEILGKPRLLREAWHHAVVVARSKKLHEQRLEESPLARRFKGLMEDDILRVAGHHLKRMTYLMAIAQKTVSHSTQHPESLRTVLFERLHKRAQRSAPK